MTVFSCTLPELQRVLQIASPLFGRTIDQRNTFGLLISVNDGLLTLKVANNESYLAAQLNSISKENCSFFVPDSFFYKIVKELHSNNVEIRLSSADDGNFILLSCGKVKCKINCLNLNESIYDNWIVDNRQNQFVISSSELMKLLKRTACCIDVKQQRANLNSVLLHSTISNDTNCLYAVSTDGIKLAVVNTILENCKNEINKLLIPKKSCDYVINLLQTYNGDVTVKYTDTIISFQIGNNYYTSRLVDADFPKYQSVIPAGNDKILEVNTSDFMRSVKTVLGISSIALSKITLTIRKQEILISAEENGNNASDSVECMFSDQDGQIEINCNGGFLLDILSNINCNITRFAIADNKSPILIRPLDDINTRYVFMPMI